MQLLNREARAASRRFGPDRRAEAFARAAAELDARPEIRAAKADLADPTPACRWDGRSEAARQAILDHRLAAKVRVDRAREAAGPAARCVGRQPDPERWRRSGTVPPVESHRGWGLAARRWRVASLAVLAGAPEGVAIRFAGLDGHTFHARLNRVLATYPEGSPPPAMPPPADGVRPPRRMKVVAPGRSKARPAMTKRGRAARLRERRAAAGRAARFRYLHLMMGLPVDDEDCARFEAAIRGELAKLPPEERRRGTPGIVKVALQWAKDAARDRAIEEQPGIDRRVAALVRSRGVPIELPRLDGKRKPELAAKRSWTPTDRGWAVASRRLLDGPADGDAIVAALRVSGLTHAAFCKRLARVVATHPDDPD